MPNVNTNPVGSVAAARPPQNALLRGVLGKLSLKDVRNAPSFSRCQLGRTPGIHEQTSHGDAIGYAHDVMKEAMQTASRNDAKALGRTLELLSYGTNDNLGPVLLVHLTAIGAVREGVAALLRESPGDEKLATHLKQLDDAIVKTGIKAGKCELAEPDAVYLAQYPTTEKVCDAVAAGKKVMTHCAAKIGGPALLAGIAQAVLPQAMMDSLAERLPERADTFLKTEGVPEWSEVLQAQAAWHLNKVLKSQLESGGTEDLQSAVIQLLKTPEYILRSQRGGEGDDSDGFRRPDMPADAPAWVKQGAKDGAPILYNVVNCGGNSHSSGSHRCGAQLEQIRNLLNDAREDSYERGRLTEIVRFQEHHIDRLERELQAERERNGPGEVRARRLQNERRNNASVGTGPLDEELDSIPDLDAGRYQADRRGAGVDQTDNSEHPPQRREHLSNASNNALPPDFDLGPINPNDRAWALLQNHTGGTDEIDRSGQQREDQLHNPANGVIPPDGSLDRTPDQDNGGGLVRRQLGGDDQTDRSNSRPQQNLLQHGSDGAVPPADDLGDVPTMDIDHARVNLQLDDADRTDSAAQPAQQQVGEGKQWLGRQPVGKRPLGAGAPADDGGTTAEFKLYLQALGIKQDPPLLDPFPTSSGRMYYQQGAFVDGGPGENITLSPKDFIGWRKERDELSGVPFASPSTGRQKAPPDRVKPELIQLIDTHGPGNLSPKHVLDHNRLRPAKATSVAIRGPDTTLDLAFASMRKKRMEALYSASTPTARAMPPRALSAQQESSPVAQSEVMGANVSLRSLSNTLLLSSDDRSPTRAEILADSRSPRGELQRQAGVDQGLQFARSTSRLGSGVAQIVKNSDPQPQSDVFAGRTLSSSNLAPTPRNEELQQPGAFVKAEKDGTAPVPRSAHMVALEQAVQMLRLRRSAELVKTADDVSSDTYSVAPFERGVSEESQDSGNGSPARLNEGDWGTPVKRVGDVEPAHMQKYPRMRDLDLSFAENHHVEVSDASIDGPEEKVVHVEHHEHVVHAKRQGTIDQAPVTLWSTQPSLTAALRTQPSVHISNSADSMDALIQELTESFQSRAAAQAAT